MPHVLVVKEAYGDLRRGDVVTDLEQVSRLSEGAGNHFVKREAHPHEMTGGEAPAAEPKAKNKAEKEAS